jgi:acyl-CoA synthetase (NDP forming)
MKDKDRYPEVILREVSIDEPQATRLSPVIPDFRDDINEILFQAKRENRTYLMEHECKEMLETLGIATTGYLVAGSEDEAVEMSRTIGYPVVLKVVSPDIVHKTDAGGVKLNLKNDDAVRGAYREMMQTFRYQHVIGISVQKMAEPGLEAIIGVTRDPNFGAVLMFGLGGIFVEVLKDVTFRILPVTREDVEAMIGEIKGHRLLEGYRGQEVDREALIDLILKISDLVTLFPEIRELDLNPVFLYKQDNIVVDARMFIGAVPEASTKTGVAESLHDFFYPKSIAVLGASGVPGKLGYNVFRNLLFHAFTGRLYPINAKGGEVQGVKAYGKITDVPDPVDLAIVIVPAAAAEEAISQCCEKGVRYIVVETAGFAETGEDGKKSQRRIKEIIEKAGARLLGPNCSGVINTHHNMVQSIGLIEEMGKGNIGMIAQAGVYAAGILTGLRHVMNFGIVATIGNKMDISETDILEYLGTDDHIDLVSIYMEDVTSGRRFIDVAKKVTAKKPVIVLKSGRTEAGQKAVASHTASLAGNDEINAAAFRQSGIIRARDNEHLFGLTKAFARQPIPRKNSALVVTYTGSLGVAATDTLYTNGMRLADLEPERKEQLWKILPDYVKNLNPVDFSFSMDAEQLTKTLQLGIDSDDVGGLIVVLQGEILGSFLEPLKALEYKGKPILTCVACKEFMMEDVIAMEKAGFPVYSTVEMAAETLSVMYHYGRYRKEQEENR